MNNLIIILLIILIIAIGYAIFLLQNKQENKNSTDKILLLERDKTRLIESKIRLESELEKKSEELWILKGDVKRISKDRDELVGKYETLMLEKTELQWARKYLEKELAETKDSLARHESEAIRKQKEFETQIHKLDTAEKALEDERQRIRREDETKQAEIISEQNRIWNDHEQMVLSRLRDACQKSSIGFPVYDNTNLPSLFTKFKPDALIPFLGQYIVFDAKKSRHIRTYIPEQVKSTAKKYKDIVEIYPMIFFVIPAQELQELKTLSYLEAWFSFYIISVESIEPLLASFKKITEYENIADFDPQDREAIVTIIANYDRHLSLQNAANIVFTKESIDLMNSKNVLHPEVQKEILIKKESMRTKKLNEAELKKIWESIKEQEMEIEDLLKPKMMVQEKDLSAVSDVLS
jgi:hypothetical protein